MVVTVYLFFGLLISFTYGMNPDEDHNLGIVNSTADFSDIDQTDQDKQDEDGNHDLMNTVSTSGESSMYEAPTFTNYKKMVKINVKPVGNMVTLKCKAFGIPTPNITWYKNNEEPKRRSGTVRYRRWNLSLEDLVADDSGNYTCVVCNILGCISYTSILDVVERIHHRPIITDSPQNKTVVVGSNVSFTCRFISDLDLHSYWVSGISPDENNTVKTSATSQNPEILELHNVTYESEGWYTCVSFNDLGHTFASAYLKVVDTLEEASQPQSMHV